MDIINQDVERKINELQKDSGSLILNFHCPNHCECTSYTIPFMQYKQDRVPICPLCLKKMEYSGTSIKNKKDE